MPNPHVAQMLDAEAEAGLNTMKLANGYLVAIFRSYQLTCYGKKIQTIVHYAIETGAKRIIGVGTCAEYDWSSSLLNEHTTPCVPTSMYGKSKLALYRSLSKLCSRSQVSFAWARLFFLYGPYERPGRLISDVVTELLAGREMPCTDGAQIRDFMNVTEAGAAIIALMESDVTGVLNIASGQPLSVRQLVSAFAQALQREDLIGFGSLPRRADDPAKLVGDNSRLVNEVGFQPTNNLAAGVQETIAWWRNRIQTLPAN